MDLRAILMGLAFVFMWSSAFTSARMIVMDAPPMTALAIRFLLSGAIAVGLALAAGQSWRLTRPQLRSVLIFGLCQNALYLGLNFFAMQTVEASLASIIASTMPLLVALLGWALFRERVNALGVAGLLAGALGVALIMGARVEAGFDAQGVLLCGIAALALAIATLTVRSATSGGNLLMIVGLQMFVGAALLGTIALLTETWEVTPTLRLGLAFTYTVLFPGLVATWVWFRLVSRIGAVRAAAFHFLNPFFGVATAWVLLGEALRLWDFVGVAIVMAGILAVQVSKASDSSSGNPG
jgi:drug/metabolite transporter (DMT)-like permease